MSLDELEKFIPDVVEEPIRRPPSEPPVKTREPPRKQKTPWYSRPFRLLLVIVLAAALIVGGVMWWLQARQWETTDDAFIDTHMVLIAPQVAGRVKQVLVDDNQKVTAGQLLVEIDPAIFQAQLDQAEASRAAAAGGLAQANAQQAVALANAQEARAQVGVAQANATNAARQLQRTEPLVQRQFASRQQLDNDLANARSTGDDLDRSP